MSAQLLHPIDFDRDDPLYQIRRQFLLAQSLLGVVLSGLGVVLGVSLISTSGATSTASNTLVAFMGIILVLSTIATLLVNVDRSQLAALLLIIAHCGGMVAGSQGPEVSLMLATLALLTAAVQRSRWIFFGVNIIVLGWMAYLAYLGMTAPEDVPISQRLIVVTYLIVLFITSLSMRYFMYSSQRIATAMQRSAGLMYAAVDIGQITAKFLTFNELFSRTVELVRDRFGYSHAQIFLIDGRYAQLIASTGADGALRVEQGYKIEVGSQTVIGRVAQIGEVVSVSAQNQTGFYAANEMIKGAASELTLPILDGEHIIGMLDVQDKQAGRFSAIDVQALQVVAGQLSAAIRNARLFEEQQTSIEENERLYGEAQRSLAEIRHLNRMLTKSGWDDYLEQQSQTLGVTMGDENVKMTADWSELMIRASEDKNPMLEVHENENITAVPITLRGEVLGAIEVVADKDAANKGELLDMVQSVAQQLAVSLENVRLFEEAQDAAVREQRINHIVQLYQSADTVDDLLKITLAELSQTFAAEQGTIRLGNLPEEGGKS